MIDMKIRDEELSSYSIQVKELGECIEDRICRLKAQLEKAYNYGVKSGTFHDNLILFVEILATIQEELSITTNLLSIDVGCFLGRIDILDGQIY